MGTMMSARVVKAAIAMTTVLLCGCHSHSQKSEPMRLDQAMKLIDARQDWSDRGPIEMPRNPSEKFLKGMTIVIDPGHGGTDGGDSRTKPADFKAGPTGVKEAYMNLRVSLLLERLLKDAGVNVILTRHGDDSLSLGERA